MSFSILDFFSFLASWRLETIFSSILVPMFSHLFSVFLCYFDQMFSSFFHFFLFSSCAFSFFHSFLYSFFTFLFSSMFLSSLLLCLLFLSHSFLSSLSHFFYLPIPFFLFFLFLFKRFSHLGGSC